MVTPPATRRLTVLCGLPFSGKTTYARERGSSGARVISRDTIVTELLADRSLREQLRNAAADIAVPISTLYATREENAFNDLLTREYVHRVAEVVRMIDDAVSEVIIDGMHLQSLSRGFVPAFPNWHRIAAIFPADAETCIQRFSAVPQSGLRATLTPDMIRRLGAVFTYPTTTEGFEEIEMR